MTVRSPRAPDEIPSNIRPGRLVRLQQAVEGSGALDVLVLTDPTDVRWSVGFTGSNGWLIVAAGTAVLITDGRYGDQAADQVPEGCEIVIVRTRVEQLEQFAARVSGSVGFDPRTVTVADHRTMSTALTNGARFVEVPDIVADLRRSKDDDEIAAIVRACAIADDAVAAVVPMLMARPSEADVRDELDHRIRRAGADGPSFETIVAAGPEHAARPHHRPTSRIITASDAVIIDVGALVEGYHSDMTRTFFVGDVDPLLPTWFEAVHRAQESAIAAVAPGVVAGDIDRIARSELEAVGLGEYFVHGTGHGVGLAIHEGPAIGRGSDAVLRVGDVVTVEPGVYRDGLGGVRIEDLVLVTADGHRVLTATSKESTCLPSPRTT
jgi:Xaa-Pro aminopeptidase